MCSRRLTRIGVAALAAVLSLALAGTAAAKTCQAVAGDFTSVLVPPPECVSPIGLCTRGTLTGDLPSTYDFVIQTFAPAGDPANPARFVYTGTSVITKDRGGAQLFGQDTGFMDIVDPTAVPFETTVNIVGGTKQYKNASGQIVAAGTLNFVSGEAVGTYSGVVCKKTKA